MLREDAGYRLRTFDSEDNASRAGATLTHTGGCGLYSSPQYLAVYMTFEDLTQPVRECGVQGLTMGDEVNLACLEELGFTRPCAQIWLYNTKNTRTVCLDECLELLDAPYQNPDGSLNACLACDEAQSGPVFKAVAGRTRRNTGWPAPCAARAARCRSSLTTTACESVKASWAVVSGSTPLRRPRS
ncbi:MAG: hypothetical protein AB8I08_34845 [Sandaracinaceae bacterium]